MEGERCEEERRKGGNIMNGMSEENGCHTSSFSIYQFRRMIKGKGKEIEVEKKWKTVKK